MFEKTSDSLGPAVQDVSYDQTLSSGIASGDTKVP